jgi:uncharacterized peroxidase-related enzyme
VESGPASDRGAGFLAAPPDTPATRAAFDDDLAGDGYVMELTRVWAHQPDLQPALGALLGLATEAGGLSFGDRAVLVAATASAIGDPYCGTAWGTRLAGEVGDDVAAAVLRGDDTALDSRGRALAGWARRVAASPDATSAADVQALRDAGLDDATILAVTVFVAGRVAFSTINAALGARPDPELVERASEPVLAAVESFSSRPRRR